MVRWQWDGPGLVCPYAIDGSRCFDADCPDCTAEDRRSF